MRAFQDSQETLPSTPVSLSKVRNCAYQSTQWAQALHHPQGTRPHPPPKPKERSTSPRIGQSTASPHQLHVMKGVTFKSPSRTRRLKCELLRPSGGEFRSSCWQYFESVSCTYYECKTHILIYRVTYGILYDGICNHMCTFNFFIKLLRLSSILSFLLFCR